MKTNNQFFPKIFLVILNFVFLMLSTSFNHIPAAYSQNQSSIFQAEAKALDDMPAQKVNTIEIEQEKHKHCKPVYNSKMNTIDRIHRSQEIKIHK